MKPIPAEEDPGSTQHSLCDLATKDAALAEVCVSLTCQGARAWGPAHDAGGAVPEVLSMPPRPFTDAPASPSKAHPTSCGFWAWDL